MKDAHGQNAAELRRRLLKGALGASSVLTLGYGGAAAAASLGCIAKIREIEGGYPLTQFTTTDPGTASRGSGWQWVRVDVFRHEIRAGNHGQGGGKGKLERAFDGFQVNGTIYATEAPETAVFGSLPLDPQPHSYPKSGWVLAYYDDEGGLVGTYPNYTRATEVATPATASCLASITPGGDIGGGRFSG